MRMLRHVESFQADWSPVDVGPAEPGYFSQSCSSCKVPASDLSGSLPRQAFDLSDLSDLYSLFSYHANSATETGLH